MPDVPTTSGDSFVGRERTFTPSLDDWRPPSLMHWHKNVQHAHLHGDERHTHTFDHHGHVVADGVRDAYGRPRRRLCGFEHYRGIECPSSGCTWNG